MEVYAQLPHRQASTKPSPPPTATWRCSRSSEEMAYVLFLKGTRVFRPDHRHHARPADCRRTRSTTYTLLIANYPKSEYAKDAREKMVIAVDQLAGKEMSVGRYYAGNGQYAAAINRFRVVVDKYQTSTHIEEALFRLTEANLALGLTAEAQTAAAVLGHNYPSSEWYKDAYALLQKVGLEPKVNKRQPARDVRCKASQKPQYVAILFRSAAIAAHRPISRCSRPGCGVSVVLSALSVRNIVLIDQLDLGLDKAASRR